MSQRSSLLSLHFGKRKRRKQWPDAYKDRDIRSLQTAIIGKACIHGAGRLASTIWRPLRAAFLRAQ